MTQKESKTAFGRPVSGEVSYYTDGLPEQLPSELWLDALDELLAVPGVAAVRWRQYTPYFNDGDACEFGVHGTSARLEALEEVEDGEGQFGDYEDNFIDNWSLKYHKDEVLEAAPSIDFDALRVALDKFAGANEGGQHFVMQREQFGDPGIVTATKDGFNVEFYDHD